MASYASAPVFNASSADFPAECEDMRTLWVGDVESWMDEAYLMSIFSNLPTHVKLIRDKSTYLPLGYGFVEFESHRIAQHVLNTLNGTPIPATNKRYRLSWASRGIQGRTAGQPDAGRSEYSLFVGDLDMMVRDCDLLQPFYDRGFHVMSAKVILDGTTGVSRGFGFVRFASAEDAERALDEMHGVCCHGRPMKIRKSVSTKRQGAESQQNQSYYRSWPATAETAEVDYSYGAVDSSGYGDAECEAFNPYNFTLTVGGLDNLATAEQLATHFGSYGTLLNISLTGKGCAFVTFYDPKAAENALVALNGSNVGNSRIRVQWKGGAGTQGTVSAIANSTISNATTMQAQAQANAVHLSNAADGTGWSLQEWQSYMWGLSWMMGSDPSWMLLHDPQFVNAMNDVLAQAKPKPQADGDEKAEEKEPLEALSTAPGSPEVSAEKRVLDDDDMDVEDEEEAPEVQQEESDGHPREAQTSASSAPQTDGPSAIPQQERTDSSEKESTDSLPVPQEEETIDSSEKESTDSLPVPQQEETTDSSEKESSDTSVASLEEDSSENEAIDTSAADASVKQSPDCPSETINAQVGNMTGQKREQKSHKQETHESTPKIVAREAPSKEDDMPERRVKRRRTSTTSTECSMSPDV